MSESMLELPTLANWGEGKWREQAACRGANIDYFFPEKTSALTHYQVNNAKKICMTCSVRPQCLSFAIENNLIYGVYGGVSATDRRGISIDSITEESVKVRVKKAHYILKFAWDEAPFETLSRLTGLPVDTVERSVKDDADIFI